MTTGSSDDRTPWQIDRDRAEATGKWPEAWGPFHRHFANDAIHRDGGPECDQPGTPRRVYVFDPDALAEHEAIVARWAAQQAQLDGSGPVVDEGGPHVNDGTDGDYYRQSTTACCPRQTIPDSCSCLEGCECLCRDCSCGEDDDDFPEYELP